MYVMYVFISENNGVTRTNNDAVMTESMYTRNGSDTHAENFCGNAYSLNLVSESYVVSEFSNGRIFNIETST